MIYMCPTIVNTLNSYGASPVEFPPSQGEKIKADRLI